MFFALVFATYWGAMAQHVKRRNAFILLVSYVFYGWWDWRFLSLIFVSSLSDYLIGLQLAKASDGDKASAKKGWVALSLLINLGILGTFKYLNFFLDSLQNSLQALGLESGISGLHLDWVLPVGISFYTFQTLSYTLDIGRGQLKSTRDPIAFFAFVSFFMLRMRAQLRDGSAPSIAALKVPKNPTIQRDDNVVFTTTVKALDVLEMVDMSLQTSP